MTPARPSSRLASFAFLTLLLTALATPADGQGILIPGAGIKNRSMGGVAHATPIDLIGALRFNPATITKFDDRLLEVSLDTGLVSADLEAEFTGPMGSVGADSDDDAFGGNPSLAYVWHTGPEDRWSLAIGGYGIAGGAIEFPVNGAVRGNDKLSAAMLFAALSATAAYQVTDRFSVGLQVGGALALMDVEPGIFGGVNDANGDASFSYGEGDRSDLTPGIFAQVGAYWEPHDDWALGLRLQTPTWFADVDFKDDDELGGSFSYSRSITLPMEIGVGVSYRGFEDLILSVDVRWIDYESSRLLGDTARLRSDGSINGLGWRDIFALHAGIQWSVCDAITLRAGYIYNENPVRNSDTVFNLMSPGIYEHTASVGFSWQVSESTELSAYYAHSFENDISGALLESEVSARVGLDAHVHWGGIGLSVRF